MPSSFTPRHFLVMIGGFAGPNTRIEWTGEALRCRHSASGKVTYDPDVDVTVVPGEAEWTRFWAVADEAGLWEWTGTYRHSGILDGTQWRVEAKRGARDVDVSGSNAYPTAIGEASREGRTPAFDQFMRAVEVLTGLSGSDISL